jgi:hypothetical protein
MTNIEILFATAYIFWETIFLVEQIARLPDKLALPCDGNAD